MAVMLEGELVRLRPLDMSDLERNLVWFNDQEITYYVSMRYPVSRGEEEEWMRAHQKSSFDSVPLGIVSGDKECWDQGYGTDAVRTALRFAFQEMNLNRVWLRTFEFNERAAACYRRCGFREEGRQRQHLFKRGRYWDAILMGILREEFEALEAGGTVAAGGSQGDNRGGG